MTNILRSDLFRNFMGGFVIGAIALFALQPPEVEAMPHHAPAKLEAPIESPVNK